MFNKPISKNSVQETPSVNIIGAGTNVTGEIQSNGDFRIDGQLKGTINIKGKLVVGPSGKVDGEVNCQNAELSGELIGKINVNELLTLKATSRLNGDIITGKIAIEPDAQFTGTCSMGGVVKNMQTESESRKEAKVAN
jgi:cytoskeletal protein CcmA (bactofilin family)